MDALTTCNACDSAPMAPGQEEPGQPGYCTECLPFDGATFASTLAPYVEDEHEPTPQEMAHHARWGSMTCPEP